jgi:ethanolamine ammonia-lyase small subunit
VADKPDATLNTTDVPEIVRKIRARTPARLLLGRSGAAYHTATQLDLRQAHAAARDAVGADFSLNKVFDLEFVKRWALFEVRSNAVNKEQYLLRPDLGRQFNEAARATLLKCGTQECDLQIAIGDGLSAPAVAAQVPALLPLLFRAARSRGWRVGQMFAIHNCRVGILNEIGELLKPKVAVLLIGERPGLATTESLSAYMSYQPKAGQTDADRNLVSNIHARGLSAEEAAVRILNLAEQMIITKSSGYLLKEGTPQIATR